MRLADGTKIEHDAQAEAGINLSDGVRWWGTRIKYRTEGQRRWTTFVLVDVHPFDYATISEAIILHIDREAVPA